MNQKLTAVKGMNDLLPPDSHAWVWLEGVVHQVMARFAYSHIRTPIVEPTALFIRGLGEVTDIVEKEMYSFEDRLNHEQLTLRPEATAGVVRAVIEHNMLYEGGKRLYYTGPMFRHERPQRGRYRQFHQIGAEALGFAFPEIDAELILMAHALWQELGLKNIRLELNSLGEPAERTKHRAALIAHFEAAQDLLDEDAKRRLYSNPLRILDTKNPAMHSLVEAAPKLIDFLGQASKDHLAQVCKILDKNAVSYSINPRLVRGMDYYNLTVFEFITDQLGSQGTICGGGRYDYLIAQMGGKSAPAVGWAIGVERVIELLKEADLLPPPAPPDIFAVVTENEGLDVVMQTLQKLRSFGLSVQMHSPSSTSARGTGAALSPPPNTQSNASESRGSMKSQFKRADSSGASYALIFGADELANAQVTIKPLRQGGGEQRTLPLSEVSAWALSLHKSIQAYNTPILEK
jgi:histidyl-tRNA synthetase